jgi:hypothetical protein
LEEGKEGGFAARWDHSGGSRKGRLEEGELSITVVVHLEGKGGKAYGRLRSQ